MKKFELEIMSSESTTNFIPVYSKEIEDILTQEFKEITKDKTYLDHAGATLYSKQQIQNVHHNLATNLFGNPHSKSTVSKATEDLIDSVRYQILEFFGTTPTDYSVIFTSGATSALKLVAETFNYHQTGELVYLEETHTSVLGMREYAERHKSLSHQKVFQIFDRPLSTTKCTNETTNHLGNSLFVYPAQCNFSGYKYPLDWVAKTYKGYLNEKHSAPKNWYCLLDAASFVSTNQLDLSKYHPDFVCVSFYKIFGYPTGLGALLVRNQSGGVLKKQYFGGGTVYMALASRDDVVHRENLPEKFEDGTISFLAIASLKHGFDTLKRCNLNMPLISQHVFNLGQYVYGTLKGYTHFNNKPVCVLYHDGEYTSHENQGGIVNFNILRADGSFIGFAQVMHMANLYNISLRTGCFCNPGACQRHLQITADEIKYYYEMGHVCGDQLDLIDGKPTGSVRISFGYMSTLQDATVFLQMMKNCFVDIVYQNGNGHIADNHFETRFDSDQKVEGILENIYIYPVKSCAAFEIEQKWNLIDTGLKYDRQWMIVNRNGTCVTQKHDTKLCMIKPIVDSPSGMLTLEFDGFESISVELDANANNFASFQCHSKICGDKIEGWDCGDEVAEWLDMVLCHDGLRLLRQFVRNVKNDLQLSLVNKAQFLLVNKASIQWLYDRVPNGEANKDENIFGAIARFRPNFLIDFGKAFVENDFKEMYISQYKFHVQGKCTRCQMICIDQKTGEKTVEPLRTLSRELQGKIFFGIYLEMNPNIILGKPAQIAPAMKTIAIKNDKDTFGDQNLIASKFNI